MLPAAAWPVIGLIGEFVIKYFWLRKANKEKRLASWRGFVESQQNKAEESAELRRRHRQQKKDRQKWIDEQKQKDKDNG